MGLVIISRALGYHSSLAKSLRVFTLLNDFPIIFIEVYECFKVTFSTALASLQQWTPFL